MLADASAVKFRDSSMEIDDEILDWTSISLSYEHRCTTSTRYLKVIVFDRETQTHSHNALTYFGFASKRTRVSRRGILHPGHGRLLLSFPTPNSFAISSATLRMPSLKK